MSIALHYKVKELEQRIAELERCLSETRTQVAELMNRPRVGRPPKETADGRQPANRGH
jgi:phage shock protein A